jgi:hypothetical protein
VTTSTSSVRAGDAAPDRHLHPRRGEREDLGFDDLSLIQLIVERGAAAVDALPASIARTETAVAETIENNVRKLIIKESPVDPAYYEKMSKLLDALIAQRLRNGRRLWGSDRRE